MTDLFAISIFGPDGEIRRTLRWPVLEGTFEETLGMIEVNLEPDEDWIAGVFDPDGWRVIDGTITAKPQKPGEWARFNPDSWSWIDPRTSATAARDAEVAARHAVAALRAERDRRLAASDWTQLPDNALTEGQQSTWRAYRQALRDLPETADPSAPEWPVSPLEQD